MRPGSAGSSPPARRARRTTARACRVPASPPRAPTGRRSRGSCLSARRAGAGTGSAPPARRGSRLPTIARSPRTKVSPRPGRCRIMLDTGKLTVTSDLSQGNPMIGCRPGKVPAGVKGSGVAGPTRAAQPSGGTTLDQFETAPAAIPLTREERVALETLRLLAPSLGLRVSRSREPGPPPAPLLPAPAHPRHRVLRVRLGAPPRAPGAR